MRSSKTMQLSNHTLSYIQALEFACQCNVQDEFLDEYGGPLSWAGVGIDFGELFVFIDNQYAKI
jgi:hypothetical protein